MRELAGRTVVVTGAGGYVGDAIARALVDVPCTLRRVARAASRLPRRPGVVRVEDVDGDVRDPQVWDRAIAGADAVLHLAAQTSVYVANEDPAADLAANVVPVAHLLEACRRAGTRPTLVLAGSATQTGIPARLPVDEEHPDAPVTMYDLHKLVAERYLETYRRRGLAVGTTLRLANVYGPGPLAGAADRGVLNRMAARALAGERLTIYGKGEHLRDYVYVDDVARAFLAAAVAGDRLVRPSYLVATGQGTTFGDAVRMLAERVRLATGRTVDVVHVDPPADLSPIESRNFVGDASRLAATTGWTPRVDLATGLDLTIASLQERRP